MNILYLICMVVSMIILLERTCYAYIDPGTGSFILQSIIAIAIGGALFFKSFFRKIKGLLAKTKRDNDQNSQE